MFSYCFIQFKHKGDFIVSQLKLKSLGVAVLATCGISAQAFANPAISQQIAALQAQTQKLQAQLTALQKEQAHGDVWKMSQKDKRKHAKQLKAPRGKQGLQFHGVSVVTSPYVGLRSPFDGSHLLVNAPSINEDLYLLKQKTALFLNGQFIPQNAPVIVIGGKVEGQFQSGNHQSSDFSLGSAELNINALASQWASAFMSIDYDSSTANPILGNLDNSSRLYMRRAFVTIGDLNVTPLYGSLGQMYVPFGTYSYMLVTSPVTSSLAKTDSTAVTLGYHHQGVTVVAYGFNGHSVFNNISPNKIDSWGANASWAGHFFGDKQIFGVGYISTLADGLSQLDAGTYVANLTRTEVPGLNLNANLHFHHVNLIAEYICALSNFKTLDFTAPAPIDATPRPSALDVELGYQFTQLPRPVSVYAVYDHTTEGANFNLPRNSYAAVMNTNIFKNTALSVEYRRNNRFIGIDENMFTTQLGVYF